MENNSNINSENQNQRKTFKELIEQFPPEFRLLSEQFCEKHMVDTINMISDFIDSNDKYNISISNMDKAERDLFFSVLEIAHNWGFYGGMEFTLAPDQEYKQKNLKIKIQ